MKERDMGQTMMMPSQYSDIIAFVKEGLSINILFFINQNLNFHLFLIVLATKIPYL